MSCVDTIQLAENQRSCWTRWATHVANNEVKAGERGCVREPAWRVAHSQPCDMSRRGSKSSTANFFRDGVTYAGRVGSLCASLSLALLVVRTEHSTSLTRYPPLNDLLEPPRLLVLRLCSKSTHSDTRRLLSHSYLSAHICVCVYAHTCVSVCICVHVCVCVRVCV